MPRHGLGFMLFRISGFRGLGFEGFRVKGFRGLGFRVLAGFGFWGLGILGVGCRRVQRAFGMYRSCMYLCHVCMYVCVYVCIYVFMYTGIYRVQGLGFRGAGFKLSG